jgi:hypothetical protein
MWTGRPGALSLAKGYTHHPPTVHYISHLLALVVDIALRVRE